MICFIPWELSTGVQIIIIIIIIIDRVRKRSALILAIASTGSYIPSVFREVLRKLKLLAGIRTFEARLSEFRDSLKSLCVKLQLVAVVLNNVKFSFCAGLL